jgi:hypothetical protein
MSERLRASETLVENLASQVIGTLANMAFWCNHQCIAFFASAVMSLASSSMVRSCLGAREARPNVCESWHETSFSPSVQTDLRSQVLASAGRLKKDEVAPLLHQVWSGRNMRNWASAKFWTNLAFTFSLFREFVRAW